MDIKKKFGLNVKKYRKLQNLTQEELAELIDLDSTSISAIETGKFFPTLNNIQKLAATLNINLETLFLFDEENSDERIYQEVINIINSIKSDKPKIRILRSFLNILIS